MRKLARLPFVGRALAAGAALLLAQPVLLRAGEVQHLTWDQLAVVSEHKVRLALADGVVTGTAAGVEADALMMDVKSATSAGQQSHLRDRRRCPEEECNSRDQKMAVYSILNRTGKYKTELPVQEVLF